MKQTSCMKCILLQSPGEVLEGIEEMLELGYDVIPYSTSQAVHELKDTNYEYNDFFEFLGFDPQACNKPCIRSLRISFVKMLLDPKFKNDDLIIFGESDATPVVSAHLLKTTLEKYIAEYPDTDIFRLFYSHKTTPSTPFKEINFIPFQTKQWSRNSPYVWGTHAMVIPSKSRKKIANIFLTYTLPTDTALEFAHSRGKIKIMISSFDCFYQKPRKNLHYSENSYSFRKRKIALCLSSYKRIGDLLRQIHSFMHQSYTSFHLFVAVKGISEYFFKKILIPECKTYQQEGRLTLRLYPNKNQLSNFIDTVRNIDISSYDLFAKIDDDDFYGPSYLETINNFHTIIPQNCGSYYCGRALTCHSYKGFPCLEEEELEMFGSSLVLTKECMDIIIKCELNPDLIQEIIDLPENIHDFGFREDSLFHSIMMKKGSYNIYDFVKRQDISLYLIIQKGNNSVTRGGFLERCFREQNTNIHTIEDLEEHIVEIECSESHYVIRIFQSHAYRLHIPNEEADVILFNDKKLIIDWGEKGKEEFEKNAIGVYVKTSINMQ